MAPNLFVERDFSILLNDSGGYGHIFVDRIRAWNWYSLVYDNNDYDAYYCPDLVTTFYNSIDHASVNFDTHQFVVHMPFGDIFVTIPLIAEITNVPIHPHHSDPLPLLDYIPIMGGPLYNSGPWAQSQHDFSKCSLHWTLGPTQHFWA